MALMRVLPPSAKEPAVTAIVEGIERRHKETRDKGNMAEAPGNGRN